MQLFQRVNWKGIAQRLAIFFIAVVLLFVAYLIGHGFEYVSIWSGATSFGLLYLGAMFIIVALTGRSVKTGIEMAMFFVLILETIVFGSHAMKHKDVTMVVFVALFLILYIVCILIYRRNFILKKRT